MGAELVEHLLQRGILLLALLLFTLLAVLALLRLLGLLNLDNIGILQQFQTAINVSTFVSLTAFATAPPTSEAENLFEKNK